MHASDEMNRNIHHE